MDALITAGGIPLPGEYLYEQTMGKPKSLLDVGGRPMIQWVLDALNGSNKVDEIFIVGLQPDANLHSHKTTHYIADRADMLENITAGTLDIKSHNPNTDLFLMLTADIPALTATMVDWVIDQAEVEVADIYYFTIRRRDMESRYPTSHRTYTRFKDVEICTADIFLVRAEKVLNPNARWRSLLSARKNPLKQAAIIGYDVLLGMLLHRVNLEDAVRTVAERLQLKAHVDFSPYPEMGMDVDKDFQLEIMRKDLKRW